MTSETDIEKYLCEQTTRHDGMAYKWTSPGKKGVPDRICVFPGARIYFVETKRPGVRGLGPLQRVRRDQLRDLGFIVILINTRAQVDAFITDYVLAG